MNRLYSWGLAAFLFATAPFARADDPKPTEPDQSLFVGRMQTRESLDVIADYHHRNGAQVTLENVTSEGENGSTNALSIGLRSPRFFDGRARFSEVIDFAFPSGEKTQWGHTDILELFPLAILSPSDDRVILRLAVLQNSKDVLGVAGGIKIASDDITIEDDVGYDGSSSIFRGFAAYVVDDHLYIGFGGVKGEDVLNMVGGWINPKKWGVYTQTTVDLQKEAQSGKVIIADRFAYDKRTFDFKSHVLNGTEAERIATDGVLDGWAPPDAYASDHCSTVLKWSNDPKSAAIESSLYYRPSENLFVGVGGGDKFNKEGSEHRPFVSTELYVRLWGPFESWGKVAVDVKDGSTEGALYLGGFGEF